MNSTSTIIGAGPAPSGVTPNFTNPDSIAYRLIIIAVVFPALSLTLLSARLYTKHFLVRSVDLADYSIVLGFLCSLAYSTLQIAQTWFGVGRHIWEVPLKDFEVFLRMGALGGNITYGFGTLFIKLSILLFYLQLSAHRPIRVVIYSVMFVSVGYNVAGLLSPLYICTPIRSYWDFSVVGKCWNINAFFVALSAINVATDIAMLLLPIWLLRPLHVPKRQKIGVTIVLMMGSFVCIVSIARLALIPGGLNDTDTTWHYVNNLILIMLEMHVGVICACLPSLKPLTKHYFPSFFEDHFTIPEPSLRTLPPLEPPSERTQQSTTYSDDSGYQTNSNNDPKSQLGSRMSREKESQALASSTILPTVQQPGNAVVRGRGVEIEHVEV
ncbi:hypothetical protein BGZ60DRAFT_420066 [Tricladium varicosporioides]|nr:hypothetical protein BGZ60DRAFT_420066 [Hymenoscyphus varicosporioides]